MEDLFIKTEGLCFSYKDDEGNPIPVLHDVDIGIRRGEFLCILGRNGSGKSTFAKLLNMILTPDSGKIYVDGTDITDPEMTDDQTAEIRRKVGMVFQNPDNQLVATIVEEDVAFGPENMGVPSDEIRRRVDGALAAVGMTEYARHSPSRLSGGQKQRVAIAGTIAMRRRCVIFDESTAMLDPMGRREVMDIIEKLNREEGITVLLITHHMNEAARADRILVMNEGRLIADGTPSDVFGAPVRMWAAGLDVPQTTELAYKLREKGLRVPLDLFDPEDCARAIAEAVRAKKAGGGS